MGENRLSARNVDLVFTLMPHFSKEETRKDCRRPGWNTSRTVRGGSCDEPPVVRTTAVLPNVDVAARHCMIPGEGAGVGEMGVPALPTAAQNLRRPRRSLQDRECPCSSSGGTVAWMQNPPCYHPADGVASNLMQIECKEPPP